MSWWHPDKFEARQPCLKMRMEMMRAIRLFFDAQGFYEVETPLLQVCPTVDVHLHGFETKLLETDLKTAHRRFLQTSPELDMKKLLVAGVPKLYQICKVFRNGEGSRLHSPEFTMLEWYRANADYTDIMDDCVDLLRKVAESLSIKTYEYRRQTSDPFLDWQRISIFEAFERFAQINLEECLGERDKFAKVAKEQGLAPGPEDEWDDIFFRVMAEKIEPQLGMGAPCILYDYPAHMAALSRVKDSDNRVAERFELYVCGIELANAFSELTDASEQRARIEADLREKERLYGAHYPVDEEFLRALEYGMPKSGGIALGVDRLTMLASGAEDISQVLWGRVV